MPALVANTFRKQHGTNMPPQSKKEHKKKHHKTLHTTSLIPKRGPLNPREPRFTISIGPIDAIDLIGFIDLIGLFDSH